MSIFKIQDMTGIYNHKDDVVKCLNCMEEKEFNKLKEEEILTYDKTRDIAVIYFCDSCKSRII